MRYTNNSKKTLLTPAQSYPMIWGCVGANLLRCVHFEQKKTNKTELDRVNSHQNCRDLFNFFVLCLVSILKLLVFLLLLLFFFCLIKFNVILFNVTRRFRAKFANFVWLWGMMYVISLGIWSNISSGCAPEPTAWAHFVLIFIENFCFVSLSHTFLVDSSEEMTCLTASPFRSNAAWPWW